MPESLPMMLRLGKERLDALRSMDRRLVRMLESAPTLADRVQRLMTIPGVGIMLAISNCGLCGSEQNSAGKLQRTPISKQRSKHLQTTLIEVAKVAPRWRAEFALVHEAEKQEVNRNRATLSIARKLVGYLISIDRENRPFSPTYREVHSAAPAA